MQARVWIVLSATLVALSGCDGRALLGPPTVTGDAAIDLGSTDTGADGSTDTPTSLYATVLCQNRDGYLRLSRLLSAAYRERGKSERVFVPRHRLLADNAGLVALLGRPSELIATPDLDAADRTHLARFTDRLLDGHGHERLVPAPDRLTGVVQVHAVEIGIDEQRGVAECFEVDVTRESLLDADAHPTSGRVDHPVRRRAVVATRALER